MAHVSVAIAMSHTPFLFASPEEWTAARAARSRAADAFAPNVPEDTLAENTEKHARCMSALETLRGKVDDARPDVLLIFGDDQLEQFSFQNFPALCVFVGDSFQGYKISPHFGLPVRGADRPRRPRSAEHWVEAPSRPQLARQLVTSLVAQGFDLAFSTEINEHGIGHAFTRPLYYLTPSFDVPTIPIYINCYYGPQPTGRRCHQLGRAIAEFLEELPEDLSVGVVGSGGLWHTPMEPNAYIDREFDQAVLDALRDGDADRMADEFDARAPHVDQRDHDEMMRASAGTGMVLGLGNGTGETRNWIAAGAVVDGIPGEVVDYVEINASPIGAAFAYWKLDG